MDGLPLLEATQFVVLLTAAKESEENKNAFLFSNTAQQEADDSLLLGKNLYFGQFKTFIVPAARCAALYWPEGTQGKRDRGRRGKKIIAPAS